MRISCFADLNMSRILTLKLSEQVFNAIQQQAKEIGIAPEQLATILLEQRFGQIFKQFLSEIDKQAARLKFEQHFGTLNLEQETDLDNESIDADLAKEYANTHEVE